MKDRAPTSLHRVIAFVFIFLAAAGSVRAEKNKFSVKRLFPSSQSVYAAIASRGGKVVAGTTPRGMFVYPIDGTPSYPFSGDSILAGANILDVNDQGDLVLFSQTYDPNTQHYTCKLYLSTAHGVSEVDSITRSYCGASSAKINNAGLGIAGIFASEPAQGGGTDLSYEFRLLSFTKDLATVILTNNKQIMTANLAINNNGLAVGSLFYADEAGKHFEYTQGSGYKAVTLPSGLDTTHNEPSFIGLSDEGEALISDTFASIGTGTQSLLWKLGSNSTRLISTGSGTIMNNKGEIAGGYNSNAFYTEGGVPLSGIVCMLPNKTRLTSYPFVDLTVLGITDGGRLIVFGSDANTLKGQLAVLTPLRSGPGENYCLQSHGLRAQVVGSCLNYFTPISYDNYGTGSIYQTSLFSTATNCTMKVSLRKSPGIAIQNAVVALRDNTFNRIVASGRTNQHGQATLRYPLGLAHFAGFTVVGPFSHPLWRAKTISIY